jgi:hypothetical protein
MDQKVKQHRFLKNFCLLKTPKKLIPSHLLRSGSGSGSDQKGPDRPDPDPQHCFRIISVRKTRIAHCSFAYILCLGSYHFHRTNRWDPGPCRWFGRVRRPLRKIRHQFGSRKSKTTSSCVVDPKLFITDPDLTFQ